MTAKCFVDANVFVYARDPNESRKQRLAVSWLARLWQDRLGRTSTQVLSEYYHVITRKLQARIPAAEAWDDVLELLAWRPHPIDEALLRRAREVEVRYRLSWWDGMVVAAAQLQDCGVLLTEDLQDGARYGEVTVRSPFTLSAEEPRAQYARPAPQAIHRPRGRPKRAAARA